MSSPSSSSSAAADVGGSLKSVLCPLLSWKDPAHTGKVLGAILALFVLAKVNIFNFVFRLAYLGLLAAAAAEYAGRVVTGQGFVTKYAGTPKFKAASFKQHALPVIGDVVETAEAEFYKVVYAQNVEATLKAAGVSYVFYKLTSWFSVYNLLLAVTIFAFSGPYVYQANSKEIDAAVAEYTKVAKDKSAEYTKIAKDAVVPHLETLAKNTGPVGSFIQSKITTRTAGTTVGSHAYSPSYKPHSAAAEPSVGVTTGATKFPEVPSQVSSTEPKSVTEAVEATAEANL